MYYVLLYVLLRGTSSLVQYFRCHIVCVRTVCCILYVCGQCSSLYVVMRTFLSNVVLHMYLLVWRFRSCCSCWNVCMYYVLLYVLLRGTSSLVQYFRCHIVCVHTVCCILYVCGQCSSLYVVMRTFLSNVVLHVYLLVWRFRSCCCWNVCVHNVLLYVLLRGTC